MDDQQINTIQHILIPATWEGRGDTWILLWIPVNGDYNDIDIMCPTGSISKERYEQVKSLKPAIDAMVTLWRER
jgi:hypothetical protein